MYTIERKYYGLRITMGNQYAPDEIERYVKEKEEALREFEGGYSLLVDLRTAIPPNQEEAEFLRKSQAKMDAGLIRQAWVIHSPVVRQRANQLVVTGPIKDRTRIIDSSASEDWEEIAMNWILYGTEPDSHVKSAQKRSLSPEPESQA